MVPLVLSSTTVPLPLGALGVGEQVGAALFRLADHANGAVVMMGFRALSLLVDLIGLGAYVANIRRIRTLARKQERAGVRTSRGSDRHGAKTDDLPEVQQ